MPQILCDKIGERNLTKDNLEFKVLEAYTRDVGRGVIRIDYSTMKKWDIENKRLYAYQVMRYCHFETVNRIFHSGVLEVTAHIKYRAYGKNFRIVQLLPSIKILKSIKRKNTFPIRSKK